MASFIQLYGFAKQPDDSSASGFCQKLETFFRAANIEGYTHVATIPPKAPKGKLPYISLERDGKTEVIPDTHFIVEHLVRTGVAPDLDASLTPVQRAESRAWEAWTEERMYPAIVHTRMGRPHNFATLQAGLPVPAPLRPLVGWYLRRQILSSLWYQGVGRHSSKEIDSFIREWVDALADRLEDAAEKGGFFHGSEPTMVDVVVYGFLANMFCAGGKMNKEMTEMLLGKVIIRRYVATLTRRWFPEYDATVLRIVA
ncbi:hypothetical protein PLICRDRAFT_37526 [Plicaturopsis crispa FD-325 SS-3]|nr:hypothetical protein PLICRDRAFT_37526 [Plicaturopsis crispa FD-325 SS-3]